jgi:hypothetical protein
LGSLKGSNPIEQVGPLDAPRLGSFSPEEKSCFLGFASGDELEPVALRQALKQTKRWPEEAFAIEST